MDELIDLKRRNEFLEKENEHLKEEVEFYEKEKAMFYEPSKIAADLEEAKKDLHELRYEYSELSHENDSLKMQLSKMDGERTKSNNKFKKKVARLPVFEKKVTEVKKDYKKLKMDKVSIEIDLKNSKAKCNELDGQLEAAQTKIDTLTETIKRLEKYNKKNDIEKETNTKLIGTKSLEINQGKAKINELETQIIGFKTQMSNYLQEQRADELKINKLETNVKGKKNQIEKFTLQIEQLKDYNKTVEEQLKEAKKLCLRHSVEFPALKIQYNTIITKMKEMSELPKRIFTLEEEMSVLSDKYNGTKRLLTKLQKDYKQLETNNEELKLQKKVFIFTGQGMSEVKNEIKQLKNEVEMWKKKFHNEDFPIVAVGKVERNKRNPNVEYCDCKVENGILKQKHCENKIFRLKSEIESKNHKIEQLYGDLNSLKKKILKNHYDLELTEKQTKKLNIYMKNKDNELLYCEFDAMDKKHKSERLEIITEYKNDQIKLLQEQDTLLCNENNKLHKTIGSMQKDALQLKYTNKQNEKEIEKLKNMIYHLEKHVNNDNPSINENREIRYQKDIDKAQQTIDKLRGQIVKFEELTNNGKMKNKELTDKIKEVEAKLDGNDGLAKKELREARDAIGKYSLRNRNLMLKNKFCANDKRENQLLKYKMVNDQMYAFDERAKYQKHLDEIEEKVHFTRIPESIYPDMKLLRQKNERLLKRNIELGSRVRVLQMDLDKCLDANNKTSVKRVNKSRLVRH